MIHFFPNIPKAIGYSESGSLIYIFTASQLFKMFVGGGSPLLLAGQPEKGFANGQGTAAMFDWPQGVAIHPITGMMYFTDYFNARIRTCTPLGLVGTLAGNGQHGNVDGDSSIASFRLPYGILIDSSSTYLYVTCQQFNTLRRVVVTTGYTITIAGQGLLGGTSTNDGQGLLAGFRDPGYV